MNHTNDSAHPEPAAEQLKRLEQTATLGAIAHLPCWDAFTPDRVTTAVNQLLDELEAEFARLEAAASASWSGLMVPLEAMQLRLGALLGSVSHLLSVKYSDDLQAAYDAVRPRYVAFANQMSQSRPLFDAMVGLRDGAQFQTLSTAQGRVLSESIRGMERSGVHLEGQAKVRYEEIQQRLSMLSNDFQTNLVKEEKDSRINITDKDQIAGVPGPIVAAAADMAAADLARQDGVLEGDPDPAEGPWHFVVNGVNYSAVVQYAESSTLREAFYRAFRERGTSAEHDNRPIVEELLRLRQEEAQLVGFDHFADLSIDSKMAPSVEVVWSLLDELERAARPAAEREFEALEQYSTSLPTFAGAVQPWDVTFLAECLREERFGYDSEALRAYFQMPRVLDGLFALTERLYGVEIRAVASGAVPVWDDSVSFYEVIAEGSVIAGFFVDPYARPGEKRGGAWMNDVVGRSTTLGGGGVDVTDEAGQRSRRSSLPVALFVMNGRPPEDGGPALMSLDEVRTLFHEFGHATQHMFTDIDEGGASGMNLVEWDAVELASQFNEYWMEHKPFLKGLTAHIDSGAALDDETLERIIESRNFMVGNATLRQLQLGKTDLALHQRYGLPGSNDAATPFQIEQDIARETVVVPLLDEESQLPAFGHLFAGGYAAGYYSYKWAEVLAADAFAAFKEAGLDDPQQVREVAERFRQTVLGLGGSVPAAEVYRQFRGRDASADALLVDQGLKSG